MEPKIKVYGTRICRDTLRAIRFLEERRAPYTWIDVDDDPEALRAEKIASFRDRFANPYIAAERGWVDAIIRPRDTRRKLIKSLLALDTKAERNPPKKHGNIPL